jgi:hypothetical protein
VLVLAAAALAEVRAEWFNSIGGSRHDTKQPGPGEAPLYLRDFHFHDLARSDEGNEDDKILSPGNAFATKGDVVNRQGQLVAQSEVHARENRKSSSQAKGLSYNEDGRIAPWRSADDYPSYFLIL